MSCNTARASRTGMPISPVCRQADLCPANDSRQNEHLLGSSKWQAAVCAVKEADMAIQKTDKIWHNGKLIPWEEATLHVMSHVVNYGSSVFEGIRCYAQPKGPVESSEVRDRSPVGLWGTGTAAAGGD